MIGLHKTFPTVPAIHVILPIFQIVFSYILVIYIIIAPQISKHFICAILNRIMLRIYNYLTMTRLLIYIINSIKILQVAFPLLLVVSLDIGLSRIGIRNHKQHEKNGECRYDRFFHVTPIYILP